MVAVCTGQAGFRVKHCKQGWDIFHRAAHKTGGGAQGRWGDRNILKNRKKSNAYFGKSLVRLACNQEKNKEKFR